MAETEDFGSEEGFPWLPLHVLDEACFERKDQLKYTRHHADRDDFRSPATAAEPFHELNLKFTSRPHRTTRYPAPTNNMAFGGPGMQAVFLVSGQRSCGTGVFLPRRAGTNHSQPSTKPACSPVLLPSRVIQALKLNVHDIGLQIKPNQESMKQYKNSSDCNLEKNRKKSNASGQYCSPEIFLPKEWTY